MNNAKSISEVLGINAAAFAIVFKRQEEHELNVLFHQTKKAEIALNEECTSAQALAYKELVKAANKYPGININDDSKMKILIYSIYYELKDIGYVM
jgi:hypothetical protein